MRVALRRGKEPLVADEPVLAAASAAVECMRFGAVRAHVRAALFFGHAHADHHRTLLRVGQVAGVVIARIERRAQGFEKRGLALQDGDAREGHGERAQRAGFELRVQKVARAARGHGAALRVRERQCVQTLATQQREQRVPGRMEFERVDAFAARVVRGEFGRVTVREVGEGEHVGRAQRGAIARERLGVPAGAFALHGGCQRRVAREQVVVR
jgi:hypothetical protein